MSSDPLLARAAAMVTRVKDERRISANTTLSPERLAEAVHYLSSYGTATLSVDFWMNQGFIERACQAMLNSGSSSEHFVDAVLVPAITRGRLGDLIAVIERGDLQTWKAHVIAAAKYLLLKTLFSAAYHFQVWLTLWLNDLLQSA